MDPQYFIDVYTQTDYNALSHFCKATVLIRRVCVVRNQSRNDLWWDEAAEKVQGLREPCCGK